MVKACFGGIWWCAVLPLLGILIVIIVVTLSLKKAPFDIKHLFFILGAGIGVGPLVMHLLNFNSQSEVHISTILEEKETYVAHGLAWSYYFNYLDNALPKFQEAFPDGILGPNAEGIQVRLKLDKLILLISHDCTTVENLQCQDNKIMKECDISNGKYIFPVYKLPVTYNNIDYKYVIKYVMQPLETLQKMSQYGRIPSPLDEKELEYQVKFFVKTLSDILKRPFNNSYREKCILIPIKAESIESLENGGLLEVIMSALDSCNTSDNENAFIIVPPAQNQDRTAEPRGRSEQETNDYETSDERSDRPPTPSSTGETENQPMSSNPVDGGENCLGEEEDNAGPAPSCNPPVSDHTGENEDQSMSTYVDDGRENSPGREEDTTSAEL